MDKLESAEVPLQGHGKFIPQFSRKSDSSFQGPKRAIRLCILGILLPGLLISVPIYLRYRVYDHQLYPVGMSDMRLIDGRVSTTWCQSQLVYANTTFNAFLMNETPKIINKETPVTMTRHLLLTDDMKEYWGFYLLKGSRVTVSTCCRWPGASLILIRGHRHLHECAYIGDDSSEEIEELMELAAERGVDTKAVTDSPTNNPEMLKKHRPEINFHDPHLNNTKFNKNYTISDKKHDHSDEVMTNAKEMRHLLTQLFMKANKRKQDLAPNTIVAFDKNNVDKNNLPYRKKLNKFHGKKDESQQHMHREANFGNAEQDNFQFKVKPFLSYNAMPKETSSEIFEDVLKKLQKLGSRGKLVLEQLQEQFDKDKLNSLDKDENADSKLEILLEQIAISANPSKIDDIKVENTEHQTDASEESYKSQLLRKKRELILQTALGHELNQDDDEANVAVEEGFTPDDIADHHHIINETTLNDRSNSEFWSSFSSSEEALLNCAGLILSLPLTPHRFCDRASSINNLNSAMLPNTITYTVPSNGYYFFVFNSENEIQENYIRVDFNITKTIYDVKNPIAKCSNSTSQCSLPLGFFSNEKVVFELPIKNNDSLWNEEFVVISECEPRTIIYLVCVLAVPLLVLFFAFQ